LSKIFIFIFLIQVYPQYRNSRKSWGINALGTLVVEVEDEAGRVGVGVTIGGAPGCWLVEEHLSRFVEGQDPRDVELMWDQMFRATLNYGRKGLPLQAISAVDLALWDLLGKVNTITICIVYRKIDAPADVVQWNPSTKT